MFQMPRIPLVLIAAAGIAAAAPPQGGQASAQPEMTTLTSTFIPGDKTLFYDDFSDMGPDDAPARFKVRGAGLELRAAGAVKQLTLVANTSIFPNITNLPKNWTIEAEIRAETTNRAMVTIMLASKTKQVFHLGLTASPKIVDLQASLRAPYSELGRKRAAANWDEPVKLAVWLQEGRLRVYTNGEKQLDFNQVELEPIDSIEFSHGFSGQKQSLGYRSIRIAESVPDFSKVITAEGRYVTRGILFDTGSDRIKPESAPVIQFIARGLEANPSLRILIEGHTDSTGNAAQNMDLSKRRAEAVKSVLSSQFKIDAARLSTAGMGSTKPVDNNDTPLGRAQNRRVELVKQ